MKKRLLCALLLAAFLLPAPTFAAAPTVSEAESPIVISKYQDMKTATVKLTTSGKTATYDLKVTGSTAVTKITATLQVQKKNSSGSYSNFGSSWSASANSRTLYTSGTKAVDSGGTYRLKATITLHTKSGSSMETVYS